MGLAAIHRTLYRTENLAQVDAEVLLEDVVGQIVRVGAYSTKDVAVSTDFTPIALSPDLALPLSLLVAEAVTNALKHFGTSSDGRLEVNASLRAHGQGTMKLEVSNSIGSPPEEEDDEDGAGLGNNLIAAFAMQMGGRLERIETADEYTIVVSFDLPKDQKVGDLAAPERAPQQAETEPVEGGQP